MLDEFINSKYSPNFAEIQSNCCPCCSLPMETKGWNNANKGNHINSCRGKKFEGGDLVRLIRGDSGMILLHTCGKPGSWDTWVHEEYLTNTWEPDNYREVALGWFIHPKCIQIIYRHSLA